MNIVNDHCDIMDGFANPVKYIEAYQFYSNDSNLFTDCIHAAIHVLYPLFFCSCLCITIYICSYYTVLLKVVAIDLYIIDFKLCC